MERPDLTFRQAQAVHDLLHVVRGAGPADLGPPGAVADLLDQRAGRFETDNDLELYIRVAERAADPSSPSFLAATALLLADRLQNGLGADALDAHPERYADRFRAAPPAGRAAIVHGFIEDAESNRYATAYSDPSKSAYLSFAPEDRLTRSADALLPALKRIAHDLLGPDLSSVAAADYGDRAEQHREALVAVLREQDCLFTDEQSWFPSEVVELVAHVRSTPGFVGCTALLLVNAIATGDPQDWFSFRWENLAEDYHALPKSVGAPILAGIRYLYESDAHFLGYYTRTYDPILTPERLIPVVSDKDIRGPMDNDRRAF